MQRRDILFSGLLASGLSAAQADARNLEPKASTDHRNGQVALRDTTLFVRDWGAGRPVLFLSSWGFSSDAWQYQMLPLCQQGFRCVAYDRRGHGRSSDPGGGYDYDTLAADLDGVLRKLDLRDVVLVAYSMSSGEAVRYLSRYGSRRVSRLILLAPTTPLLAKTADNPDGVDVDVLERTRAYIAKDLPGALAAGFGAFVEDGVSEDLKAWCKGLMMQCSLQALLDCQRAFTATDFRAELPRLTVPTLVLQGDADKSAPLELTGRKTAALVPRSRMVVYPGAPHGLVFTHTAKVNDDIVSFARS